jgi:hypothetical protein
MATYQEILASYRRDRDQRFNYQHKVESCCQSWLEGLAKHLQTDRANLETFAIDDQECVTSREPQACLAYRPEGYAELAVGVLLPNERAVFEIGFKLLEKHQVRLRIGDKLISFEHAASCCAKCDDSYDLVSSTLCAYFDNRLTEYALGRTESPTIGFRSNRASHRTSG